jgi:Family of unknown function (DUF5677)
MEREKPRVSTVLVRQFVDGLEEYLNGLQIVPEAETSPISAVMMLLSKSLTVARSICILVDAGFPAEAFGVSRTLVEIYFNVRYICNKDSEVRAEQFVTYWSKIYEEIGKIREKFYPDDHSVPPEFHEKAMAMAVEFRSKHSWSGRGGQAGFMAREEDSRQHNPDGKPIKSEFDYVMTYFMTSQFVHATVQGLESHYGEPGKVFVAHARRDEDRKFGTPTLLNVVEYISKAFDCASRSLGFKDPEIARRLASLGEGQG